jgi:hypothetical protein
VEPTAQVLIRLRRKVVKYRQALSIIPSPRPGHEPTDLVTDLVHSTTDRTLNAIIEWIDEEIYKQYG